MGWRVGSVSAVRDVDDADVPFSHWAAAMVRRDTLLLVTRDCFLFEERFSLAWPTQAWWWLRRELLFAESAVEDAHAVVQTTTLLESTSTRSIRSAWFAHVRGPMQADRHRNEPHRLRDRFRGTLRGRRAGPTDCCRRAAAQRTAGGARERGGSVASCSSSSLWAPSVTANRTTRRLAVASTLGRQTCVALWRFRGAERGRRLLYDEDDEDLDEDDEDDFEIVANYVEEEDMESYVFVGQPFERPTSFGTAFFNCRDPGELDDEESGQELEQLIATRYDALCGGGTSRSESRAPVETSANMSGGGSVESARDDEAERVGVRGIGLRDAVGGLWGAKRSDAELDLLLLSWAASATLDPLARAEAMMISDVSSRLEHALSQLSAQEEDLQKLIRKAEAGPPRRSL